MRALICVCVAAALVGCKRDDAHQRSSRADARPVAAHDAPARVPDAAAAPIADAALIADAAPVDAAVRIDAGAPRPRPRPPADAAAPPPIDAAPPPPDAVVPAGACHRTRFETELVEVACREGGQTAAKLAMKRFTRAAKKQERSLECKSCHEKLAPAYPLKDDALEHFRRLGGA